jgi:integrase
VTDRRRSGHATVEEHPKGSGRYRVRARVGGKLTTIASGLPESEAADVADAFAAERSAETLRQGITLTSFGAGFLARRERAGVRGIREDRGAWARYIDRDPIGALPVATLGRRDIVEWLDRLTRLAHQTRKNALNLLRVGLAEAVDRELLAANPARDVRVHRSGAARSTDGLEGVLTPAEQQALLAAVPDAFRPMVAFALCTGLRQSEQWWLRWEEVGPGSVMVRRSGRHGTAPKNGRPREVFLLPPAIAALASLPRRGEWVFPGRGGERRSHGTPPKQWHAWLRSAGITRRVRWHDLRHTCATSLLAGWWGRKWTLDEVCRFLGHSGIQVTERYARKLAETQRFAVDNTPGFVFPLGNLGAPKMLESKETTDRFVNRRSRVQISKAAPQLRGVDGNALGTPGAYALALAAEDVFARRAARRTAVAT